MNDAKDVLTVSGLNVSIRGQQILTDLGLSLKQGRIHVVLGASGSGKSTLLRTLIGLSGPHTDVSSALFRLDVAESNGRHGQTLRWNLTAANEHDWLQVRACHMGLIFQDPEESLTSLRRTGSLVREVFRNVGQPLPRGKASEQARLDAAGLGHHDGVGNKYCFELSGGMAQRLGLALAAAGNPAVLLADEPSTALDGVARRTLASALRDQADAGTAVLLVTHDRDLAAALADDITVLAQGHSVESGPAWQVLADPQHPETQRLLARPRPVPAATGSEVSGEQGTNSRAEGLASVPSAGHVPLVLRVQGLRQAYSSREPEVLRGLDLSVASGESVGLLGRSGSGKSTLIRCLVGLERPSAGLIEIAGSSPTETGWKSLRRRVQLVPQDPRAALNPWRSALEQIMDPLDFHQVGSRGERRSRAMELLAEVGLSGYTQRRPGQLSTGQCQRVSIARALAISPSLLVADEPVTALDAALRAEMLILLHRLTQETGTALLVVSHELPVLEELCPRICVLDEGRIVEELGAGNLGAATSRAAREIIAAQEIFSPLPFEDADSVHSSGKAAV